MDETVQSAAYWLERSVAGSERALQGKTLGERGECCALILVTSTLADRSWSREIQEYLGTREFFEGVAGQDSFSRTELALQHSDCFKKQGMPFGEVDRLTVLASQDNENLAYSAEDDIPPIPYDRLYLPMMTPTLPKSLTPGISWKAAIDVSYELVDVRFDLEKVLQEAAAANENAAEEDDEDEEEEEAEGEEKDGVYEFELPYSARATGYGAGGMNLEVELDEEDVAVAGDFGSLIVSPKGLWTVVLSDEDKLPVSSEGSFEMRIGSTAQIRRRAGGRDAEGSLLMCKVKFALTRIPVELAGASIDASKWQVPRSHAREQNR